MHRNFRHPLATTAIVVIATPAAAETISTAITQPVRTSTIKNGTPDSITIASSGSVKPASGTAVTIDSNHSVTNQGTIAISNADSAIGILAQAGTSGDIVNSGTITIDETYTATDTDNDGDLDGPFALGFNRFGIRTDGAHSGKITNSGTISVEGNQSAGIWVGGPLAGAFTHDGTTTVLGNDSTGVRLDAVTGDVRLAGTIAAKGESSVAARLAGDVTGALVVQGNITASGYRHTTAPSDTSKLDADDLLQGGSALMIEGNVTGGIVLAVAPANDSSKGNAAVSSQGAAPAMVIGATDRDIAIGPVAGTASGFGLIVDGTISGNGVYAGVDGNGLVVGGRGGAVSIANGIGIAGTVSASSKDSSATALRLGNGASAPQLHVSGTVSASGGNASTAKTTAIQIDEGASLPILRNSGSVKATAAGTNGSATAILDRSGGLLLVENSGAIAATGAAADSGRNIAIDLSANTVGATIRQTPVAASFAAPSITGDVRFGSGSDLFDIADGSVKGDVHFGAGDNTMKLSGDAVHTGKAVFGSGSDLLQLSGTSKFQGVADFGGGADTLTLVGSALFSGTLANSAGLAVDVAGGTLDIAKPAAIASLNVGASGVLVATLAKEAGQGTFYSITGNASFAQGAQLSLRLASVEDAEGRYVILEAGSITGLSGLQAKTDLIPFMFKATLAGNAAANTIAVDVARRSTQELGLNRSQAAAYDAIYAALGADDDIEGVFLGITDGDLFRQSVRQMLPDHAGGAFEGISLGTRTLARQVAEPQSPIYSAGAFNLLVHAGSWSSNKDEGTTAAYELGGFGFSAAGELDTGVGSFGVSATWLWNEHDDGTNLTTTLSDTYELAAYWRGNWGGLSLFGRGAIGMVDLNGRRTFRGTVGDTTVERNVKADWSGTLFSASGGGAYEFGGRSLFVRPAVTFDYLRLDEKGYTNSGGGKALDLIVDDRKSDEFAVNGGVAVGLDFMGKSGGLWANGDDRWFRVETEGGWREIVGGSLGSTTARFEGGTPFTLDPEQTSSGWYARLRARGGGQLFEIGGEAGAENRNDRTALSLRGTMRIGF